MSTRGKIIIGGVAVSLLFWLLTPWFIWLPVALVLIGVPAAGYLMLDPSQRKRLNSQARKRIG